MFIDVIIKKHYTRSPDEPINNNPDPLSIYHHHRLLIDTAGFPYILKYMPGISKCFSVFTHKMKRSHYFHVRYF